MSKEILEDPVKIDKQALMLFSVLRSQAIMKDTLSIYEAALQLGASNELLDKMAKAVGETIETCSIVLDRFTDLRKN